MPFQATVPSTPRCIMRNWIGTALGPLQWMLLVLLACGAAHAQATTGAPSAASSADFQRQLQTLSSAVGVLQQQLSQSQAEVDALKVQLQTLRSSLIGNSAAGNENSAAASSSSDALIAPLQEAVSDLKDQDSVLQSEIAQHEQTKLETASKYPVKVTGLLLFSSILNNGTVDNIDAPALALPPVYGSPNGSLAATTRQSILGFDASGPALWGAISAADLRIDFFGGLAYADYSTSAGILRLRTAHARLDWRQHALIASLDTPLISPLSPTSFVAVGSPALAWSGNLWTWSPQFEIKNHARLRGSTINYDFALIDPSVPGPPSAGFRKPNASEQSRQPGYEFRTSYARSLQGRLLEVGAGTYYSRQAYSAKDHVDSWAGSADWMVPISEHLELSGEFYRGTALGGLGGGGFKDVVTYPSSGVAGASGAVRGLQAAGGWAQLKLRLPASLEANAAFGQDNAFAARLFDSVEGAATDSYANLARNRTTTANIIFKPKTYLLFTTEFRYLRSWPVSGASRTAPVLGIAAGYLF